jgi:hypothetical protein
MISVMQLVIEPAALLPAGVALFAGVISTALYGRRRRWTDALLVLAATVSLAMVLAVALDGLRWPAPPASTLTVRTDAAGVIGAAEMQAIPQAASLVLLGDGARAAQWQDLPARPLQWTPSPDDALWLDFPRTLALGRMFTLTVRRPQAQAGWRVQLLAENGQLLADSATGVPAGGVAAQRTVRWLPPVAEALVLRARVLDAAGQVVAQGPVPVQVRETAPLQIVGRFNAPSFDARTLNQLLVDGGASVDWQVALGQAIARTETARTPITAPNVVFVDAAHVEQLGAAARAALLAGAGASGQEAPLVILGANAANAALWQRDLGLRLQPQSATTEKEDQRRFNVAGVVIELQPAALNPAETGGVENGWTVVARDDNHRPWLWQRAAGTGKRRVVWIGVADWHRYAISAPQALTAWWQGALDGIALPAVQKTGWHLPDPLPVPGLRSEICALGVKTGAPLQVQDMPGMRLQARADKADSVCAAIWPRQAGWLRFSTPAAGEGQQYIYEAADWPAWQRALRREATAAYAARWTSAGGSTADHAAPGRPVPATPFAVLFALCMLALWWRERR